MKITLGRSSWSAQNLELNLEIILYIFLRLLPVRLKSLRPLFSWQSRQSLRQSFTIPMYFSLTGI